jgi:hypothetical protein
MNNYNSYFLRNHNEYFILSEEEKSVYKADNFNFLKKELSQVQYKKSLKIHPFESIMFEDKKQVEDFLLSIGKDGVIVNEDPNSLLFRNLLDYDVYNYSVNYKKDYIYDLPWTNIKTIKNHEVNYYKFTSPVYFLIDSIFQEIIENKSVNISETQLDTLISDYLIIMYNDILEKTKLLKSGFVFKEYKDENTTKVVIIPNEAVLQKVDFYKFNNFIDNNLTEDLSLIKNLKNYHKNEIIKLINNKNNNIIFFKPRK